MIAFTEIDAHALSGTLLQGTLRLPFDKRRLSRLRARLEGGEEIALLLPRGSVLVNGSILVGEDGRRIRVAAADESVSRVESADPSLLARAAYHLGNRHVAVQIEPGRVSYLHDHVLDDMVRGLGLPVGFANAPFEPEAGAYSQSHGHGHAHHGHAHHDHDAHHHGHEHGHEHVPRSHP